MTASDEKFTIFGLLPVLCDHALGFYPARVRTYILAGQYQNLKNTTETHGKLS